MPKYFRMFGNVWKPRNMIKHLNFSKINFDIYINCIISMLFFIFWIFRKFSHFVYLYVCLLSFMLFNSDALSPWVLLRNDAAQWCCAQSCTRPTLARKERCAMLRYVAFRLISMSLMVRTGWIGSPNEKSTNIQIIQIYPNYQNYKNCQRY